MSTAPRNAAVKKDWGHDTEGCTILHIDMDAFYASCEVQRHSELRDKPVIIGTGARAVVSAANYEARKFGVNSAMPVATARRLCPQGVYLPVDMNYYRAMSRKVFSIFEEVTNAIEHVSVDEGYMDVSAALLQWKSPVKIAQWIRHTVHERLGLTCSVGIASNKLIAKLASTNAKPDGMLLIPRSRQAEFIQMMPVRSIPGVGPSLQRKLEAYGTSTVASLAQLSEDNITRITGSAITGHSLFLASRGLDERKVVIHAPDKSIGHERTFIEDTRDVRKVLDLLRTSCDSTASTLRARGLVARTITVKLRYANLKYVSKSFTMETPTSSAMVLYDHAKDIFYGMFAIASADTVLPQFIRLAGISTSNLSEAATTIVQASFDDIFDESASKGSRDNTFTDSSTDHVRHDVQAVKKTEKALDDIRKRFGKDSVNFGI